MAASGGAAVVIVCRKRWALFLVLEGEGAPEQEKGKGKEGGTSQSIQHIYISSSWGFFFFCEREGKLPGKREEEKKVGKRQGDGMKKTRVKNVQGTPVLYEYGMDKHGKRERWDGKDKWRREQKTHCPRRVRTRKVDRNQY
jgi:hypothetical protein